MRPLVVAIYSRSGNAVRPWAEAGCECLCVDTAHSIRAGDAGRVEPVGERGGFLRFVWGDARSWTPPAGRRPLFVAVESPCTDLTVSGARDFNRKGLALLCDGLELFNAGYVVASWSAAPFYAENPVGVISSHFRPPDYAFDPCDFAGYADEPAAEAYTKRTCLWTGNGFVMPAPRAVVPLGGPNRTLAFSPGPERQALRSATPSGFARAVFLANRPAAWAIAA
ncbi:MAG TPA: hypothetical protein VD838_01400 [Anaeromyxobacteraceae bacterium]|nr:hypothetical protein [Anaeromyxobacteraceae bacterium]